ncbi:carbonic anhydrase family protein [Cupriavidus sp. BIS7]|uniref:carbonic anhydrase n=1 Tax=Cupriavidus sp. BIS7 TaxID=1217718 RepID=UPI0003200179|nr:carbonic anhydrase family protein [Cupriavidus sp. BIS7]
MKKIPVVAAFGVSLLIALPCVSYADEGAHWTYEGHAGAKHWGDLEKEYATCKLGRLQSPIDIETSKIKAADSEPIKLAYNGASAQVSNTGHSIQVDPEDGGSITVDGVEYKLVQFHFHTPSEEKINGKPHAMVAHLVHRSADGKLAVIAVLFDLGKENRTLQPVFANLPAKAGDKRPLDGKINAGEIIPENHASYMFEGSLTTPPCSEEVHWIVMKTPMTISSRQLDAFKKLYPMNARPTQALNGRTVQTGR